MKTLKILRITELLKNNHMKTLKILRMTELLKNNHMKTLKILRLTAFWDIAPHSLILVDRRFRGVYSLHHQCDKSHL
jgi:hypothetical protein